MNINFKKKYGQNFLTDTNLLKSIVSDAGVTGEDVVVEIGAGAGALTAQLALEAKKVVAFEIDEELRDLLEEKFRGQENVRLVFKDFMEIGEEELFALAGEDFKVVANLPYYITTAILTKLFRLSKRPSEVVVMVQKEVGERIVATEKDPQYSYFSALVNLCAQSSITRYVSRKMFTPMPNVDSCVVRLFLKKTVSPELDDFLKAAFAMKRKTLANNLEKAQISDKARTGACLAALGRDPSARADSLSPTELERLYEEIKRQI